jgi:hypothetical protein
VTPSPHLDDDRLSAWLDGEATEADARHAETCPECTAVLAAWREAIAQLAQRPPPASAGERDAAVQAALGAVEPSHDTAVPLEDRRGRGRVFSRSRVLAGIAAAVVIAGIAVGVSQAGGGGSSHPSTAAGTANPPAASSQPRANASAGAALPGQSSTSIDIGAVQDQAGLVAILRPRVQNATAARTPAGSTSAAVPGPPSCQAPAADAAGVAPPGAPVVEASLTYRGAPAQVFVFAVGERYTAAVVGRAGCRLLAVVSF